ncbi:response regulator transcription factor [Streptomyces sp. SID3343]|uniref:response regulator transcription factor n=1 Tax=Streptomyces sp. SID3343 TaxID=2690260 RepID=UPI00136B9E02|nr:response regulator transcription factor [Streptomyces sp. SID3343]MYV96740.1 response regulator [Streptomyces sp. SID3343]
MTDDALGPRLLLAEDDEVIREATALALQRYGFRVTAVGDGLTALESFRADPPDAVLTDVMMPDLDGVGLTRRVRENSTVPILMISARTDPIDIVSGLEAGADDYITKPFESAVLVARLRAVMRRVDTAAPSASSAGAASSATSGPAEPSAGSSPDDRLGGDDDLADLDDLDIDTVNLEVTVAGAPVSLTATEMRLLLEFVKKPGTVLTRHTLLENAWDYAWGGDTRVVDVHVQRLRGKIGAHRIETVRGFGYKLRRR